MLMAFVVFLTSVVFLVGQSYAQTPSTPGPPTGFTAIPISSTTVSLYWSPPLDNGNSSIIGYTIEFKTPTTPYTILVNTGNVTKYNATSLATGKMYIFRVSTRNVMATSIPSSEQSATPTSSSAPPINIVPNPPQSLTATTYSATQINLSWSPPISNGGPPLTGYRIDYQLDSGNFSSLVLNTQSTIPSYSHIGVLTGHTYSYKVYAINSIGTSNSSNIASAVPTLVTRVPSPPTLLQAIAASSTSINLSWYAPNDDGGSAITGYKIEYDSGTGQFTVLNSNTGSTQTSYLSTGLATGTTYSYRVTAINSVGLGGVSNTVSATPKDTNTPTITNAVAISPTQISLTWIPPSNTYGQTITGYRIDSSIGGQTVSINEETITGTSYVIPNLTTGHAYVLAVVALFPGGSSSPPSSQVTITPTSTSSAPVPTSPSNSASSPPVSQNLPDPPLHLNATLVSQNTVQLSWLAPANTGKPSILGYKVESKSGTSGTWSTLEQIGVATTYIKSGLLNGTLYTFRISAINNAGSGQPSNEASVTGGLQNSNQTSTTTTPPPQTSAGFISVTGTTTTIDYNMLGGQVLGSNVDPSSLSLHIRLHTSSDGILFIQLPRDLIDAKNSDGSDSTYYILADKNIAKFNETKTGNYRTLAISLPANTVDVSIRGTTVVPEFPLALLGLVFALVPVVIISRRFVRQ